MHSHNEKRLIKAVVGLLPYAESEVDTLLACQKDDESEALAREVEVGQQTLDFAEAVLQEVLADDENARWREAADHDDTLCAVPYACGVFDLNKTQGTFLVNRYQSWAKEALG